ncbi:TRAP transporter large permease [Pelagibacterium luteolum]|uniref:TRAP transporter large permease protein n=1 Tax=Pelagibacterium luteolum TaxID=440168 RepID=A0A1G7UZS5_9HYPH|nr:TRAP transporter large permease [Pelagibacterium luteolum]SDG53125.1 TRAP transporter, DctM subunit [Pelagibacterium luteolum]
MAIVMLGVMLIGFIVSIPIAVSIGLAGAVGLLMTNTNLLILPKEIYTAIDKFPLAAIPFFILAGAIMERGGISIRLVNFAKSLIGGVQGGLAATCVLTCMMFAAISGSSIATTFAIGAILIPALVRDGYPRPYAAALQASSAELGVIIPPSIPLILYGVSAEVSIGELFIGGIGPGIFIGAVMMIFVLLYARWKGYGKVARADRLSITQSGIQALPALCLPVVILGGIYSGITTPTEASVVAVFAALLIGMFVYREIKISDLFSIFHKAVMSTVMIMIIIATAGLFSYLITRAGVPNAIGSYLRDTLSDPFMFLLIVNIVLLVIGMFVETNSSILVLSPILVPVAMSMGIDPVHFGLIMVVNLAIGMVTPPLGVNVYAACTVGNVRFDQVVPRLLPLIAMMIGCLMVVTYVPDITLALRDIVYNR